MDIRQLRYFVAIVDGGSLSEAARTLHIVQPALSQRLADLERELGVQLLVRGRRGVALTRAGTELYGRARGILKQIETATTAVREKAGAVRGPVAIGLLRTAAPFIAAPLFAAIKDELPQVVPHVRVGYSAELLAQLRAGQLDLTMRVLAPDEDVEPVYTERLCLVGSRKLLPARREVVQLRDLAGVPLLVSPLQPSLGLLLRCAVDAGIELQTVGGVEDVGAALSLCEAGMAAVVLAQTVATMAVQQRKLVMQVFSEPHLVRRVAIATHPDAPRTEAATVAERILEKLLRDLVPTAPMRAARRQTPRNAVVSPDR